MPSRRDVLSGAIQGLALAALPAPFLRAAARADGLLLRPPPGFRAYSDPLNGFSFFYPQSWVQVRGAGSQAFFRDPEDLDENLRIDVSSPTSSRYKGLEDLGSAEDAGQIALDQYLTEFMSTRLGVRRESALLSARERVAEDGHRFYEVEINVKSYANNKQLAIRPEQRVAKLEWDRQYLSVLGVDNMRLYAMRVQLPARILEQERKTLRTVMDSFSIGKA